MTTTYKLVNDFSGNLLCVNRSDGLSIPIDEANSDYQDYLAWLDGCIRTPEGRIQISEPNTPEPADESN